MFESLVLNVLNSYLGAYVKVCRSLNQSPHLDPGLAHWGSVCDPRPHRPHRPRRRRFLPSHPPFPSALSSLAVRAMARSTRVVFGCKLLCERCDPLAFSPAVAPCALCVSRRDPRFALRPLQDLNRDQLQVAVWAGWSLKQGGPDRSKKLCWGATLVSHSSNHPSVKTVQTLFCRRRCAAQGAPAPSGCAPVAWAPDHR